MENYLITSDDYKKLTDILHSLDPQKHSVMLTPDEIVRRLTEFLGKCNTNGH